MIDEKVIVEVIEQLRQGTKERGNWVFDTIQELLTIAVIGEDGDAPALEIAKTFCEILEPQRLGGIRCFKCNGDLKTCGCWDMSMR